MTHKESRQRAKQAAKLFKSGETVQDIADNLQLTCASVVNYCRKSGVLGLTHEQKAKRREQIANDIKNGMTLERAAKKHKVCNATIISSCKQHGVKITLKYRPVPTNAFFILKRLLDGQSPVDVAEKCEVTKQRVSQVRIAARKAGFKV